MKKIYSALLLCLPLAAAVTTEIQAISPTAVTMAIRGASGTCTLNLYEGYAASGTAHPDVTAVADSSLLVTTWADGTRIVQMGHERSNLALAADTQYTGTVSVCGSATFSFRTASPPVASVVPRVPKWTAGTWNNADYPAIDWTSAGRGKKYVDPLTGVKLEVLQHQGAYGWKQTSPETFAAWNGGSGWTNPANVASGGTSSFGSTSNTNTLDLFPNTTGTFANPFGVSSQNNFVESIGLVVYGSGDNASSANRTVKVCIVKNPSTGCDGTAFDVVLPQGSTSPATVAQVASSTTDSSGAWPNAYPGESFAGWGGTIITQEEWPVGASIAGISSGVATISSPGPTSHFPATMVAGSFILASGLGCTNNLCAITSVDSPGQVTLSNTGITSGAVSASAHSWFIRIWKTTATGQVSIGVRLVGAGSSGAKTITEGTQCHPVATTDYQGKSGHFCGVPLNDPSTRSWYFIRDEDRSAYFVTNFPTSAAASIATSGDRPTGSLPFAKAPMGFSQTDGRVFYCAMNSSSGVMSVYKITVPAPQPGYMGNILNAFQSPTGTVASDGSTWVNMTPPSTNGIDAQIAANFPTYNSARWGAMTISGGFSGDMAFIYSLNGQDANPCHISVVHVPTGSVVKVFSTMEGNVGGVPEVRWGTCHSIKALASIPNSVAISGNHPRAADSSKIQSGPFTMPVTKVLKGTWSTNTSLTWPPDSSYTNTCPSGLAQEFVDRGAVAASNQCVQLEFAGQPCNTVSSATADATFPACSWNASYTEQIPLRVGDRFTWVQAGSTKCHALIGADCEYMQVVSIDSTSPLRVTALRNSVWDYGCVDRTSFCIQSIDQVQPLNGWTAYMVAGTGNSSTSGLWYLTFAADGSYTIAELPYSLGGHSAIGTGPSGGITYASGALVLPSVPLSGLSIKYPDSSALLNKNPSFGGITFPAGSAGVQQYLNRDHIAASQADLAWTGDTNSLNPNTPGNTETTGNALVASRTLSLVSGTTDVYLIGVLGTLNYKQSPLLGWAGHHLLEDVSGPSANIKTAHAYSMCHVYRSGATCGVTGETVGDTYVRVPSAFVWSYCTVGITWANAPCVYAGAPGIGAFRRFPTDRSITTGEGSQILSYGLTIPGAQYAYTHADVGPTGKFGLMAGGQQTEGIRPVWMLTSLPDWKQRIDKNTFGGIVLKVGSRSGADGARIRWGYTSTFYCTGASEACLTDSSVSPFIWAGQTSTPTSCSAGCSIEIPAVPGRIVWYQVEWMSGSSVVATSELTSGTV